MLLVIPGLFVWWLWPEPDPPPLTLAVFDVLVRPEEPTTVCAQLEPVGGDGQVVKLAGFRLRFEEPSAGLSADGVTGPDGSASVPHGFPGPDGRLDTLVAYAGDRRTRGAQMRGRVFVWPTSARLLVVDADHTLADADHDQLWTANNLDLAPQPGISAALRAAQSTHRVVYLSLGAERPTRYNKLRAWLERSWATAQDRFPEGPVIAPGCKPGDRATFATRLIGELRQQFGTGAAGLTTRPDVARIYNEAGLNTLLIAAHADPLLGIHSIASPAELATHLSEAARAK